MMMMLLIMLVTFSAFSKALFLFFFGVSFDED